MRRLLLAVALSGCAYGLPPPPEGAIVPTDPLEILGKGQVARVDVLLVIDNSRSMADKQEVLATAVPDLVKGLVNPRCRHPETQVLDDVQPASPLDPCATPGSVRDFEPILDFHIGIVSSSMGGLLNACDTSKPIYNKAGLDDHGRLITRLDPNGFEHAETYWGKGFLAWDPEQNRLPALDPNGFEAGGFAPGEADLDGGDGPDPNGTALLPTLTDMVKGVSQSGCGYEATLESAYRFLVEPHPPEGIVLVGWESVRNGLDQTLLQQRRDFLRPDSLVSVIVLSDENDCSIRDEGPFWVVGRTDNGYHLPPPRSECANDPSDPCCLSCAQNPGSCPPDPACNTPELAPIDDNPNLRCFDQKRRFGIDFLYPISRYTEGFTQKQIVASDGSLVTNPLFDDLNPNDSNANLRDPGMVFVTAIVGVPWQDLARDPFDLTKGIKRPSEMSTVDPATGFSAWDLILGDWPDGGLPADPLMQETWEVRVGVNPPTGDALSLVFWENAINGGEFLDFAHSRLQSACIFALPEPLDCTDPANNQGCDCPLVASPSDDTNNPFCMEDPALDHFQTHTNAYPGLRHLQLVRSLGAQGLVGSICPAQLSNPNALDYGYRPSMDALLDVLQPKLQGRCLGHELPLAGAGQTSCRVYEARVKPAGTCACDEPGRVPDSEGVLAKAQEINPAWNCICQVVQLEGDALAACQGDVTSAPLLDGETIDGWCYVDATIAPPLGNPLLVANCPDGEQRRIRFVGDGAVLPGATQFLSCGD